jgi:hypothetical protein
MDSIHSHGIFQLCLPLRKGSQKSRKHISVPTWMRSILNSPFWIGGQNLEPEPPQPPGFIVELYQQCFITDIDSDRTNDFSHAPSIEWIESSEETSTSQTSSPIQCKSSSSRPSSFSHPRRWQCL